MTALTRPHPEPGFRQSAPTTVVARDHMQIELRQLQRQLRITTVLVTHDQREAMTLAAAKLPIKTRFVQRIAE